MISGFGIFQTCAQRAYPAQVCSNHNETWESDCHLHRMRCLCMEGDYGRCLHAKHKHAHVDYFGPCKVLIYNPNCTNQVTLEPFVDRREMCGAELGECTESEMADFPRRLREWLFTVMQALARQQDLPQPYLQMEEEAEHSSRRWVAAVIWKFCQLDVHPHDRWVSRHELFPLRAPLLSMEHCVAPFLDSCDVNRDHRISLVEWGSCLGLNPGELTLFGGGPPHTRNTRCFNNVFILFSQACFPRNIMILDAQYADHRLPFLDLLGSVKTIKSS
ncbi:SPARC [Cordylochernes scorpioides]|uniref:SPARC n=1 Tax=Cordylochernes scorpioides TaxID=51811 RepID=A0ABY6LD42_9ARAC|nr:SPARC [Cordylochernes scorpioides]